ncbi:MAG: putative type secretion system protein [Actinomycetota bacterium]|jgi:pilus assembly protein TadC
MNGSLTVATLCALASIVLAAASWRPPPRPTSASIHHPPTDRRRSERPRPPQRPRRLPRRRTERLLDSAVPDLFDYFVVSVQAGLPPAEALRHVLPVVHPLVAAALTDLDQRIDRGERLADALTVLIDRLGTRLAMFVSVIASCERTGLPLGPALERITDDARQHRRRLIETEARELPVRLTIPLVTCTLPAFALVAIAPLVLGAVSTLTMS